MPATLAAARGSDSGRAIKRRVAIGFIATVHEPRPWLLYVLSALLMFASPFFTSGRASILPSITTPAQLHTANSITQTTGWTTLTLGTVAAGFSAASLGYEAAFVINALSFVGSAWAIGKVKVPRSAAPRTHEGHEGLREGHEEASDDVEGPEAGSA